MRTLILVKMSLLLCSLAFPAWSSELPKTGISGVYEVMVGTDDAESLISYFAEFGFHTVDEGRLDADEAQQVYGVDSALHSYRLQNADIDSHGLLRILQWDKPLGPGVGYAPPETVGQRMAVMRTKDIVRLHDVFTDLREHAGQPWLPAGPVFDDLYEMDEKGYSISNRRVGVREMGVYGQWFNHVFFQRYGYQIPGYGMINEATPLQTSEFTHHDFMVKGDIEEISRYYQSVLGLKAEKDPVIDGDWQQGPRTVFQMEPGESHWYRGFVSPNNISGKIKLFVATDPGFVRDRSERQRVGEMGMTLHSFYTPKLSMVHQLAEQEGLQPTAIMKNEFGEKSFVFRGPDGVSWQILQQGKIKRAPVTEFKLIEVAN